MKAGLTNLETLKRHLLAPGVAATAQFDSKALTLGLGIAAMFDRYTNRSLLFAANDTVTTTADREHLVLPRYPVVDVHKVERKDAGQAAWTEEAWALASFNPSSGVVYFNDRLGSEQTLVRVTYTGGYWFDEQEPSEAAPVMPAGAVALPDDLRAAWLMQCEQAWQTHDKLGTSVLGGGGGQFLNTRISTLELLPLVKEALRSYVRYQLS